MLACGSFEYILPFVLVADILWYLISFKTINKIYCVFSCLNCLLDQVIMF